MRARFPTATELKGFGLFVALFAILFFDGPLGSTPLVRSIVEGCQDTDTQWLVYACVAVYFAVFQLLRHDKGFWKVSNPRVWLIGFLLLSTRAYAAARIPSGDALLVLTCAAIAQCFAWWAERRPAEAFPQRSVARRLVYLLGFASIWQVNSSHTFHYRNLQRWTGPWDNPNIFGVMMGAGLLLSLGLWAQTEPPPRRKIIARLLVCVVLMACGLCGSFSRGACLGTACGLAAFFLQKGVNPWFKRNAVPCAVIFLSLAVIWLWRMKESDNIVAHRAASIENPYDFSWRNRVAAWEGALQITADHPWLGAGWNKVEPLYQNFYLPARLESGAAIGQNNYLMLAASAGIPALVCFLVYVWLSLAGRPGANGLEITFRSAVVVFVVGIALDGALFRLPTGAVFWILLELGSLPRKELETT